MKLSRILAVGAATVLVGVSTLAIGGSASAADSYVLDTDFGAESTVPGTPYPVGWFTGNVGATPGTFDSTPSGLSLVGPFQILNSTTPSTGLMSLVADADLGVVSGEIAFQIPIFTDRVGEDGFTTLVPEVPGNTGLHTTAAMWRTTNDILDGDGTLVLAATGFYTLPEIETALESLTTDYEILAFGAYLPLTKSAVVSHITWDGNTHWFLPAAPTATVTPASISVTDFTTAGKGVTGVFTGFVPNETINIGLGYGGSEDSVGAATADANGTVTYTYVHPTANPGLGEYTLIANGVSTVQAFGSFTVVADTLPATGADFTPAVISGSVLLLVGAGLGAVAMRRRGAVKR